MGAPRIIPLENYLLYFTKSPDIKPYIITLEDRKSVKKIINVSFLKANKIDKRFYFKSFEYCYYNRPENQLESVEENWFLKKEIELLKFSDPLEYLKIDSTQRYLDCYDDIYVLGQAINKVVRLENIVQKEDKIIARQNKYRELSINGKKVCCTPYIKWDVLFGEKRFQRLKQIIGNYKLTEEEIQLLNRLPNLALKILLNNFIKKENGK